MARTKDVLVLDGTVVYRVSRSKFRSYLEARAAGSVDHVTTFGGKPVLTVDVSRAVIGAAEASTLLTSMYGAEATGFTAVG